MRRVIVFNQITLDGYFADEHGDMSWAHTSDPEFNAFVADNASGGGTLVFGRITYEMNGSGRHGERHHRLPIGRGGID